MISRYTPPTELVDEFMKDRERARYWLGRMMAKEGRDSKSGQRFRQAFFSSKEDTRSRVFEYDSPLYGNKWLLWWRFISRGYGQLPETRDYQVLYRMLDKYMEVMVPTKVTQGDNIVRGVTIYTDHLFQRLAQEDRLGIDMSDRKLIIKNFVEIAVLGLIDIRDPKPGEKDKQVISRLPKSFLRGHYIPVGDSYIIRFSTFIPEKTMTPSQKKFVKSFAKAADGLSDGELKEHFRQVEDTYLNI